MTNKEILLQIETLLRQLDPNESEHESFILLATTISDSPQSELMTHDMLMSTGGKDSDIAHLMSMFLKSDFKLASKAIKYALLKLSQERKLTFLPPLIQAVFLPLENQKPKSNIILPRNGLA